MVKNFIPRLLTGLIVAMMLMSQMAWARSKNRHYVQHHKVHHAKRHHAHRAGA
jgi:hypothetical protein